MEKRLIDLFKLADSLNEKNEKLYAKIIYCADKSKKIEISIVDIKTSTYVERCSVLLSNNPVSKLNAIIKLLMEYIETSKKDCDINE